MPVTHSNSQFTAGTATSSLQMVLTAAAASVLVAFVASPDNNTSAIAYGGVAMTQIGFVQNQECWALTAPAAGSNTLSAQFVSIGAYGINALLYTNVKAVGPFGTIRSGSAAATATNLGFTVSSTSTDLVCYHVVYPTQPVTLLTGTPRTGGSAGFLVCRAGDATGALATVLSATASNSATGSWTFFGLPLIFSAAAAESSVTFDNEARQSATAVDAASVTMTITSGATLIVFTRTGGVTISSVAYAGVALTRLHNQSAIAECWALSSPAAGANALSVHTVTTTNFTFKGLSYTNVGGFGTPVGFTTTGSSANAQVIVSSTTLDRVVVGFTNNGTIITPLDATIRGSQVLGTNGVLHASDKTGALAITLSATTSTSLGWRVIGVPLQFGSFVVASGLPKGAMMLLGVGA